MYFKIPWFTNRINVNSNSWKFRFYIYIYLFLVIKSGQIENDEYDITGFVTYVEAVTNLLLDKLNDCSFNILCNLLYCNIHLTILKLPHIDYMEIGLLCTTKHALTRPRNFVPYEGSLNPKRYFSIALYVHKKLTVFTSL